MENIDESAKGWSAIDRVLNKVYGDQAPAHFGTLIKYRLGGPNPLDGISVYRCDEGLSHWHYVTYGLSDLYGDLDDSTDVSDGKESGYGFELTFRLARAPDELEPPSWPLNFLQNIARYVFETGNVFAVGHWMTANGPIQTGSDTLLTEMAFVLDPVLQEIEAPFGHVKFLQVVGLTAEELHETRCWNVLGALQAMQPYMPLWITNLGRSSLLSMSDVKAAIDAGAERDGSKTGVLYIEQLAFKQQKRLLRSSQIVIALGTLAIRDLKAMLPVRLPFGRPLVLAGDHATLTFIPAEDGQGFLAEQPKPDELSLTVTPAHMRALLDTLKARSGEYVVPGLDSVKWQVNTSVITDSQGQVTGRYEE